MFLGTGSDVGKSVTAAAFCRIFKRRGLKVAPFKAQNMSNNSYVTAEGGEIGRAQVVQAEASGLIPSVHMNPILLKPSSNLGSQIILQGHVFGQMDATQYHNYKPKLKKAVMDSYDQLDREYDLIVMEGAGSCCEMNLKRHDLVNFAMAKAVDAPCILIADIDRGGVFSQIIGSHYLMTPKERRMTMGWLINKFRGDPALFSSGIDYIEKKTGKPVLGLIPFYEDILIDPEDSVVIQEDKRVLHAVGPTTINIAVVKLPAISNFSDLDCFESEPDVVVNYLFRPDEFSEEYDILILPGTKNSMEDAVWLSRSKWMKVIKDYANKGGFVFGICGGYQLLGEKILDPASVESSREVVKGLALLPIQTIHAEKKILRKVVGTCLISGRQVKGYEIHMGVSRPVNSKGRPFLKIHEVGKKKVWNDGWVSEDGQAVGTYVHGIMDSATFRNEFLNRFRRKKGLKEKSPRQGRRARFVQYDRLADHFEAHSDIDRIISELGI
jgi:adenosylcobyric acid synthase